MEGPQRNHERKLRS